MKPPQKKKAAVVDLRILATDLAPSALQRTREAVYPATRMGNLSRGRLLRHFQRHGRRGSGDEQYEVRQELRYLVVAKRLNLAHPPFPMPGPLDAVLCRNVLMYLDTDVRRGVLGEVTRLLAPGGLLMIGHAETLAGIEHRLVMLRPSVYRKPVPGAPPYRSVRP